MKALETNRIYQGDCLELMQYIPDKSIDMILCDLPYQQTTRNKWDVQIPFDKLWEQYNRIIKDNGAIVLFGNGMFTADLMESNRKMWRYNLIWQKTQPTGFLNAKRMPLRSHEDICVFYKKPPVYNPQKTTGHIRKVSKAEHKKDCKETTDYGKHGLSSYDSTERYPKSILTFSKDSQKSAIHPTQKPVSLLEYLICTYSDLGGAILDNCVGSGSTCVAALNTGRKFIGIEIEEEYYKMANERIKEFEINNFINEAKKYAGCCAGDEKQIKLIELYNDYQFDKYQLKRDDPWGGAFISAIAISTGLEDIIPVECLPSRQLELFRKMKRNKGRDYDPEVGDIVYVGGQQSISNVGLIIDVTENTITLIQGNVRNITTNGKSVVKIETYPKNLMWIREYVHPDYTRNKQ